MTKEELKNGINNLAELSERLITLIPYDARFCDCGVALKKGEIFCSDTCKKAFFEHDSPEGK